MTEPRVEAGDRALETKIEVLRCKSCGRLSISVDSVRQDTKSHAAAGHGDGKCSGQWTMLVSAESAMNAQERELARALNNLKCEVTGWLGLARPMLIQELSITNVRVMEHHVAEAERLLAERGDADGKIGIPNVPAIVWDAEKKRARQRLDAGRCPTHNIPMIDAGREEYCPECETEGR